MAKVKVKIEGVDRLLATLETKRVKEAGNPVVRVEYNTPYSTRVHEDLNMVHPRGGQAKFLEQPAREMSKDLGRVVRQTVQAGGNLYQGEVAAANVLLQASQALVPVDTGRLKASGRVVVERQQ